MPLRTLLVFSLSVACSAPVTRASYRIGIHVVSDPEVALAGALVRRAGQTLARSDDSGALQVELAGSPGDVIVLEVVCPAGYRAPKGPLSVLLREQPEREQPPEFWVRCPPTTRTVVVAVRATRGPRLPLRYLGRELARTDAQGIAHIVLQAKPGETLTLTLDTRAQPQLMPRDPELKLSVPERDELFVFDQAFSRPPVKAKPRPPPPIGPQRI